MFVSMFSRFITSPTLRADGVPRFGKVCKHYWLLVVQKRCYVIFYLFTQITFFYTLLLGPLCLGSQLVDSVVGHFCITFLSFAIYTVLCL